MTRRRVVVGTIGALLVSGGVVAAPAEAAAGPAITRVCSYTGTGDIPLRVQVTLQQAAAGGNDLRGVRVRATDRQGGEPFRDRRVRVGTVAISVEGTVSKSKGGEVSSAHAVRREGSPASYQLDPRSDGGNVSRVTVTVTFLMPEGERNIASCSAVFR